MWVDPRLEWYSDELDVGLSLPIDSRQMWLPELNVDGRTFDLGLIDSDLLFARVALVRTDGTVTISARYIDRTFCPFSSR